MNPFFRILVDLIWAYILLIMIPYALLSWFRIAYDSPLAKVQLFLYKATDPILRPVRRIIPPVGGLDFSFMVVIFALYIVIHVLET